MLSAFPCTRVTCLACANLALRISIEAMLLSTMMIFAFVFACFRSSRVIAPVPAPI